MRKIILIAAMVLVSAGAQAGGSRSLSLAGSDSKAVLDSARTAESASAVETQRAPQAADATGATDTPTSTERQKFTERPPGVDIRRQPFRRQSQMQSRPSRMSAGAGQRRQSAHMSRMGAGGMGMHRPGHIHLWSKARIVATLHRHGIYW
jgi:hypothetical protein